eukprot:14645461-Heterocapsa_arctica.AAC.1
MSAHVLYQIASAAEKVLDKAGNSPVEVMGTDWSRGLPGVAMVNWQGEQWRAFDYGDKLELDADICQRLQLPGQQVETRQCLLKATAAAVLYAKDGNLPARAKVLETAQALRTEH